MKRIAIIGSGGFGREIKTIIDDINEAAPTWAITGFYDDNTPAGAAVFDGATCNGNIDALLATTEEIAVVFGIADRGIVASMHAKLAKNENIYFPSIIHPSIKMYPGTTLGDGNVMAFGTFLACDVRINHFNLLNNFVGIGHDTTVGDFNAFMPRTQVSGNVTIGDHNFFGMNSSMIQNKTMGNGNTINAYTFLTKSIKNDRNYFGVPGRRIDK